MNKLSAWLIGIAVVVALVFGGTWYLFLGPTVTVPPGHVGRIKTPSGFQTGLKDPAVFRLPANWFFRNPTKLILAEVSDNRVEEPIEKLWMPEDKLNLTFEVVGTFRVKGTDDAIYGIYDRITPLPSNQGEAVQAISFKAVYKAYGEQIVRTTSQEVVAQYKISYVLDHLDTVSQEIQDEVNKKLENTPLVAMYCGLGTVMPPQLIVTAEENARKRMIDEQRAEATKLVNLTKADARYQVGLKRQEIDLVEAETQVLSDLILSDAVSEAYVAQKSLRVLDAFAQNPNVTFVLSTKVFEDPATLLGLSQGEMSELKKQSAGSEAKLAEALKMIEEAKQEALLKLEEEAKQRAADRAIMENGDGIKDSGGED